METVDTLQNPGNFIAYLNEIAIHSPILDSHMRASMLKNATYLSPSSQNEMIDVLGKDIIRTKFVDDIKEAGCHSISADEVTASKR